MRTRIGFIAAVLVALPIAAQNAPTTATPQKQKFSFRAPPNTGKYTQQHIIEVGDVPGHQLRVLELQRTFTAASTAGAANDAGSANASMSGPTTAPIFNGVRATEMWARGLSDYTNATGRVSGYYVFMMENGDKVFAHYDGLALTPAGGQTNATYVATLTGGTGKFKDIRGVMRGTGVVSFTAGKAGSIETQWEGEYWMER